MKVVDDNIVCSTNGRGLWSNVSKPVSIIDVGIAYLNEDNSFGELRAKFTKDSWNIKKDGLIYTDDKWIKEFRSAMKANYDLSDKAVKDIDYSEQGMQGNNYVSMDVGKNFLNEWLKEQG